MTMSGGPVELFFIRHGESEGADSDVRTPHTWRLTDRGAEQAERAGARLVERDEHRFDGYAVSPAFRTLETAARLALPGARWRVEPALADRAWGPVVGSMPPADRAVWRQQSRAEAAADPWFWAPPSGESLMQVQARVRTLLVDLALRGVGGRHLFVTHAEVIQAVRGIYEGPERVWIPLPGNAPTGHLTATGYSRIDPGTGAVTDGFSWVRGFDLLAGQAGGWATIHGPVPTETLWSLMATSAATSRCDAQPPHPRPPS